MVISQTAAEANAVAADQRHMVSTNKFKYDLPSLKIVSSLNQRDDLKTKIFHLLLSHCPLNKQNSAVKGEKILTHIQGSFVNT